jgi:DUF1680 family protein
MNEKPQFQLMTDYQIQNTESKGKDFKVLALTTDAQALSTDAEGKLQVKDIQLRLIPYYAWNHRGANEMEVWMAQRLTVLDEK